MAKAHKNNPPSDGALVQMSAGAWTGRNAFVSHGTYDKLTLGIPAMDPLAFGAARDFAMRYTAPASPRGRREVGRLARFGSAA